MSLSRRAKKRDTLEPAVVRIAKHLGWDLFYGDDLDLICWRNGVVMLVEVKTGNAPLTERQKSLRTRKCPFFVVRTLEEAEEVFR